jgi:hypothetical protein
MTSEVNDMNGTKSHHERLQQIEWLLEKSLQSNSESKDQYEPYYGDVTELNTCRLIMDSVGQDTLKKISEDAIDLLGTSVAIYEANGDYAFGMFSSGWCRLMDTSSRKLCRTDDNRIALDCGCWLCHENCWNDSATPAIKSGQCTDIQCVGGINLYAEPIFAGGKVVGVINIGYGTPPADPKKLKELAEAFSLDIEKLKEQAHSYNHRPKFMVDLAKKRLRSSANFIGHIVEKHSLIKELQKTLSEVKTLQGLFPICSHCKKIRDDKGYWNQIETYIRDHSDAEFSHGICQECAKKYYPDMDLYGDEQTQQ